MLKKVSLSGGRPLPICEAAPRTARGASWGFDNTIIFKKTLQVQFLRWLTGSATYSYVNQISDGTSGVDAQRNTLLIGLTATALPWKIMD